ncbi:MAG: DUF1016 family protein [Candidatus Electrothrix sp. AR1]|nr:DUF1016 family protein [Candidatus Electrothrix sp. AR1]
MSHLKIKIRQVQLKSAVAVNQELLRFYWELGTDIVKKQKDTSWGDGFLKRMSQDLMAEFPEMRWFSKRNLEQIRRWHLFYAPKSSIAKQPVAQLRDKPLELIIQIPWGHNIAIVSKCASVEEAVYHVSNTHEVQQEDEKDREGQNNRE